MRSLIQYDGTPQGESDVKNRLPADKYIRGAHTNEKNEHFLVVDDFVLETWLDINIRPNIRAILDVTDIMMLEDNLEALSVIQKQDLIKYRKALRAFTDKFIGAKGPMTMDWPSIPSSIKSEIDKHKNRLQLQQDLHLSLDRRVKEHVSR